MNYKKLFICLCIVVMMVFCSGCSGIGTMPTMPKIEVPITAAPNTFIEMKPTVGPTPTVNVTKVETTKPRFVYV